MQVPGESNVVGHPLNRHCGQPVTGQEVASGWGLRRGKDREGPARMKLTMQCRRKITRDYTINELITIVTSAMKKKNSDHV